MKKIITTLALSLFIVSALYAGGNITKETHLYAVKENDSLFLDKYTLSIDDNSNKPCVIFMFGGGFVTGQRDGKNYIPYFEFLAENGYTVVSIDYRLGLKPVLGNKDMSATQFVKTFVNAIYMAAEDLFDATTFVYDRAGEWKIDRDMIVANGSSAGAIAVLQGGYFIANHTEMTSKLPAGFNYAGIISFAGAIFENARDLTFQSNPATILMFHGDADSNVPYDKLKKLGIGFYGSKHIAKKLTEKQSPYWFYSFENADHSIANTPMNDNRTEILYFLDRMAAGREPLMINIDINKIGTPVKHKKFKIKDFVKANFGENN